MTACDLKKTKKLYNIVKCKLNLLFFIQRKEQNNNNNKPGGDATEDGVEVVAAEGEEHSRCRGPELRSVMVALAVCVDEMTDLWQQLFYQHGLIQT